METSLATRSRQRADGVHDTHDTVADRALQPCESFLFGEPIVALDMPRQDTKQERSSLERQIATLEKEARTLGRQQARYGLLSSEGVYKAASWFGLTSITSAAAALIAYLSSDSAAVTGITAGGVAVATAFFGGMTISMTEHYALPIRKVYAARAEKAVKEHQAIEQHLEQLRAELSTEKSPATACARDEIYLVLASDDVAGVTELVRSDAEGEVLVFHTGIAEDARRAATIAAHVPGRSYGGIMSQADVAKLLATLAKDSVRQAAVVIVRPHVFEALTGEMPTDGGIVKVTYDPKTQAWYRSTFGRKEVRA